MTDRRRIKDDLSGLQAACEVFAVDAIRQGCDRRKLRAWLGQEFDRAVYDNQARLISQSEVGTHNQRRNR